MENIKWEDITIGKYKEIEKAFSIENDVEKVVKILSVLTGKDEDHFLDMTLPEYYKHASILIKLKDIPEKPIVFLYTVNGKDYTLNQDVKKMTAAQFIDFTTFSLKQPNNYNLLLSTVLIPKGKKYGSYDIKIVANELENLCILDARSIAFFFQMALKKYTKVSLGYSIRQMEKAMKKEKNPEKKEILKQTIKTLQNGGVGL